MANNKAAMFFNLVLMISLLFIVSKVDSRTLGAGLTRGKPTPHCDEVLSVESGDTCFAITQALNMTTAFFDAINPNLNCRNLFVGEWLCIAGTVN
ncbi:hypothetical protein RJ639_012681 [Escallonia herrerae]|uniref:LysM domain-containing protein n=1 Tax=Escallonia herrerae TaxID=1293975 RepID=A0AA88VMY9_9ASTE|nr:hypothetical protein RJ639_012681 [Escallonia herrerae]